MRGMLRNVYFVVVYHCLLRRMRSICKVSIVSLLLSVNFVRMLRDLLSIFRRRLRLGLFVLLVRTKGLRIFNLMMLLEVI